MEGGEAEGGGGGCLELGKTWTALGSVAGGVDECIDRGSPARSLYRCPGRKVRTLYILKHSPTNCPAKPNQLCLRWSGGQDEVKAKYFSPAPARGLMPTKPDSHEANLKLSDFPKRVLPKNTHYYTAIHFSAMRPGDAVMRGKGRSRWERLVEVEGIAHGSGRAWTTAISKRGIVQSASWWWKGVWLGHSGRTRRRGNHETWLGNPLVSVI